MMMKDQTSMRVGTMMEEPKAAAHQPGGHPMEIYISYVLRIGVLLAGAVILLGLLLYLILGSRGSGPSNLHDLLNNGGTSISISPGKIARNLAAGDPSAIIQLGVLLLILTPTTRVAMTAILFFMQRDRVFVAITATVFLVLILGLIGVGG